MNDNKNDVIKYIGVIIIFYDYIIQINYICVMFIFKILLEKLFCGLCDIWYVFVLIYNMQN